MRVCRVVAIRTVQGVEEEPQPERRRAGALHGLEDQDRDGRVVGVALHQNAEQNDYGEERCGYRSPVGIARIELESKNG